MNKKRRWAILLLLMLGIAAGMYHLYNKPQLTANDNTAISYVEDMSDDELTRFLQEKADKQKVRLTMNPTMTFEAGSTVGMVNIQNSPQNQYSIRVMTYLEEKANTKKKILDSGVINPKQLVAKGKLLIDLEKGSYKTINTVEFLDSEGTKVGESTVMGKVIVKN